MDEERGGSIGMNTKDSMNFLEAIMSFCSRISSYISSYFTTVSLETKSRKAKYVKRNLKRNVVLLDDAIEANDRYIQELDKKIVERGRANQMLMAVQLYKERKMREVSSCSMAEGRTSMIRIEIDMSKAILAECMAETFQDAKDFAGIVDPQKIKERAESLKEIQDNQEVIWGSVQKEIAKIGSGNIVLPEVSEDDEHIVEFIKGMMNSSSKEEEEDDKTLRERVKNKKTNPEEEVSFETLLDDE